MILQMVGIDYQKADLEIRELFSFHKHSAIQAMEQIKEEFDVNGVVLLATCNRTELYISVEKPVASVLEMLCFIKQVSYEKYKQYSIERTEKDAMDHLFRLACGMKSKIFGEDQILTQIKMALVSSRDAQTTDSFLERVFQTAIATGKKVKTKVHLTAVQTSVVEEMIKVCQEKYPSLANKKCMVIGNGEIGRLASKRMSQLGADVMVTVRNYKTKQVEIPAGCSSMDYQDRYQVIGDYDIIVSATTSPHHTVKYEETKALFAKDKPYLFFDLAVPRDISSAFSMVENIELYNIDLLGGATGSMLDNDALKNALSIIEEEEKELESWNTFRDFVPIVKKIAQVEGSLIYHRAEKGLKQYVKDGDAEEMENLLRAATEKTVTSMLFDLRKNLPMKYWQVCLDALAKEIEKE